MERRRAGRNALIKFFRDGIQFWNPGDVFADDTRLLESGEKKVRNPAIAAAMRRITMCEQAGTGFRMMQREWTALGHPAPVTKNDRAHKAFELFVPGLDKEVDMASDLVKAMFAGQKPEGNRGSFTRPTDQVTDQVGSLLRVLIHGPVTATDIMKRLGLHHRPTLRENYVTPAIGLGLIAMTIPDKPNSRLQKYRLTERGNALIKKGEQGQL